MDWTQDVVIDDVSAYLATVTKETTGGKVWEAARRLLEYFYRERHLLFAQPAQRILELGSGTGWLGMTLAQNLPAQMIWLTETVEDHALVWLQQQVDRNRDAGRSLPNLEVRACDWSWFARPGECSAGHAAEGVGSGDGAAATLRDEHWDLILGSDLLYHEIGVRSLPRVLSALSTPRTRIFYAHTMYRFENFDRDFFSELLKVGLQYRRVWPTLAPWAGEEEVRAFIFFSESPPLTYRPLISYDASSYRPNFIHTQLTYHTHPAYHTHLAYHTIYIPSPSSYHPHLTYHPHFHTPPILHTAPSSLPHSGRREHGRRAEPRGSKRGGSKRERRLRSYTVWMGARYYGRIRSLPRKASPDLRDEDAETQAVSLDPIDINFSIHSNHACIRNEKSADQMYSL